MDVNLYFFTLDLKASIALLAEQKEVSGETVKILQIF